MSKHEKAVVDLQRLLSTQKFESPQEVAAFMKNMIGDKIPEFENEALSLEEQAEDLVFEALDCADEKQSFMMLMKALDLNPDCILAYEELGHRQPTPQTASVYFAYGIELGGQKYLAKEYLKENKGHFHGRVETRPFLRCLLHYADTQYELGFVERAFSNYKLILELNENDNMGVRDIYSIRLLEHNRIDAFKKLDVRFEKEQQTFACFNRALCCFIEKGNCSESINYLKQAIQQNKFVVPMLIKPQPPRNVPNEYSLHSKEEANIYVDMAYKAWRNYEGAVYWAKKVKME